VLISGGGIAGSALAFWLTRAGIQVTVVERAAAPRPGGQAVDLRGAARTVAARMGLLEDVRSVAVGQRGIALVRDDGSIAARMPTEAFGGEGIVSEIEVLRGDLAQVLYGAVRDEAEFRFDETVTSLVPDDGGVSVTFARAEPSRFDLVVGADGSHSTVRALTFDAERDCILPLGAYISWFTTPAEIDDDGWLLMYNAPGGRVAQVRPGRLPDEQKVGLAFRSGPLAYDRSDPVAQKSLVADRFADAGWQARRLVTAMWSAEDFVLDEMVQVRLPAWSRGRVVLLGDAAWCPTPLTGLGTSLALVGAYVLAGELTGADLPIALDRYEQVLRDYVAAAQELPPGGIGGFAPLSPLQIRLRATSMRWMTHWPLKRLITGQFEKAGKIDLPDYPAGESATRRDRRMRSS
jgi:2-polyprenyl-6-methoxyphenol hydroxylase-like FAD-dependent oxidoreductase